MASKITFAAYAERDFEFVFEFLFEIYVEFGEAVGPAIDCADERIQSIREDIEALAKAPRRGSIHDDILPGLRHVAPGRAIVWFDVVEEQGNVRILAVFFGGQDHVRRMLARLPA
ncbi:MAG: type II toxin-antitoxin system RelE/ParE family toxin [Albidovulum sp.]|nr:type II toxin-antitoxin system RelE/ParE family toxin [Albidovulum sp.]